MTAQHRMHGPSDVAVADSRLCGPSLLRGEVHTGRSFLRPLRLALNGPQIPEFVQFEDRVENSLARDVLKVEYVRMRLTHESLVADFLDSELLEMKFVLDRGLCRDCTAQSNAFD